MSAYAMIGSHLIIASSDLRYDEAGTNFGLYCYYELIIPSICFVPNSINGYVNVVVFLILYLIITGNHNCFIYKSSLALVSRNICRSVFVIII